MFYTHYLQLSSGAVAGRIHVLCNSLIDYLIPRIRILSYFIMHLAVVGSIDGLSTSRPRTRDGDSSPCLGWIFSNGILDGHAQDIALLDIE